MIASGRTCATAALTDAASRTSALTGSAPNSAAARDDWDERTNANATWWFSFRHLTNGRPIAPVAPAIRILIATPLVYTKYYKARSSSLKVGEAAKGSGRPLTHAQPYLTNCS